MSPLFIFLPQLLCCCSSAFSNDTLLRTSWQVTEETALLKAEDKKEELASETTAYEFNCIQRGHQNFLEQVALIDRHSICVQRNLAPCT